MSYEDAPKWRAYLVNLADDLKALATRLEGGDLLDLYHSADHLEYTVRFFEDRRPVKP